MESFTTLDHTRWLAATSNFTSPTLQTRKTFRPGHASCSHVVVLGRRARWTVTAVRRLAAPPAGYARHLNSATLLNAPINDGDAGGRHDERQNSRDRTGAHDAQSGGNAVVSCPRRGHHR